MTMRPCRRRCRLGLYLLVTWQCVHVHSLLSRHVVTTRLMDDSRISSHQAFGKKNVSLMAVDSKTKDPTTTATSTTKTPTARFLAVKACMPPRKKSAASFAVERFESLPGFQELALRDRSFGRLLLSTTERRLGQIDAVLTACQQKGLPVKKRQSQVDVLVKAVLRIGAVQLLFLKVPPHAAVKETVDVLRMHPKIQVPESRIKFVNAVLRRLSREGQTLLASTQPSDNVAPWLLAEFESAWGKDGTAKIVEAAMCESHRCLTIRQNPKHRDLLAQTDWVASHFADSERLANGSLQIRTPPPGPISSWPLYEQGAWWLQDPAATLPAAALYNGLLQQQQHGLALAVVDLCAAPGGKTAQLANYQDDSGQAYFSVTAVEVSAPRSKRLLENQARLGLEWTTVVADGRTYMPDAPVAGVLLDAPCTATGTASRRPEVLRRDADYQDLLATQYELAHHAIHRILQVGGILVYATCSLLKQESEDQVHKLLEGAATLETLPFEPGEMPGFDHAIDENGWLRVLPGSLPGGLKECDGFFVARLQRIR